MPGVVFVVCTLRLFDWFVGGERRNRRVWPARDAEFEAQDIEHGVVATLVFGVRAVFVVEGPSRATNARKEGAIEVRLHVPARDGSN